MDFNQVIVTGYIAGEYNIKEITKNDKKQNVLNGVILVNGANDKTTPIKIAAWNKEATVLNEKTVKGSHVMIVGQWNVNQYEKDGRTIYDNYLLVKEIKFMESKEEFEKKKLKLETQKDPFGNIASGKETVYDNTFDIDNPPF